MTAKLTVPERLLLAALETRKSSKTFTAENLIVEAWKMFPDTFGLSGYTALYPDSNRVLTNIMGTKGMRGKGWLRKVGEKQYQISTAGLAEGEIILERTKEDSENLEDNVYLRGEIDRNTLTSLERIYSTNAAKKGIADQMENISFHEACGFWDITARSNANNLKIKLSSSEVILKRSIAVADKNIEHSGIKGSNGLIEYDSIRKLFDTHIFMMKKFQFELDIISKRTDERIDRKRK